METYLTIEEVAKYLNYAEKTIRKWVLNKEIPFHKIHKSKREMTNREWQVLFLVCNGFIYDGITDKLTISKRTVDTHIHNLNKILDVGKRGNLRRKAIYLG